MHFFCYCLWFYGFLNGLSTNLHASWAQPLMRAFNADSSDVQRMLSVWLLGAGTAAFASGAASDRWGRRPVMVWSTALFGAACMACAVSPNLSCFLAARFVLGLSVASTSSAGFPAVYESLSSKGTVRFLAVATAIWLLTPAVAPVLGDAMVNANITWQAFFVGLGLLGWTCSALLAWKMPETFLVRQKLSLRDLSQSVWAICSNRTFLGLACLLGTTHGLFNLWFASSAFWGQGQAISTLQAQTLFFAGLIVVSVGLLCVRTFSYVRSVTWGIGIMMGGAVAAVTFDNPFAVLACLSVAGAGSLLVFFPLGRLAVASADPLPSGQSASLYSMISGLAVETPISFAQSFWPSVGYSGFATSVLALSILSAVLVWALLPSVQRLNDRLISESVS